LPLKGKRDLAILLHDQNSPLAHGSSPRVQGFNNAAWLARVGSETPAPCPRGGVCTVNAYAVSRIVCCETFFSVILQFRSRRRSGLAREMHANQR
jgi:hypothetical protein